MWLHLTTFYHKIICTYLHTLGKNIFLSYIIWFPLRNLWNYLLSEIFFVVKARSFSNFITVQRHNHIKFTMKFLVYLKYLTRNRDSKYRKNYRFFSRVSSLYHISLKWFSYSRYVNCCLWLVLMMMNIIYVHNCTICVFFLLCIS